MPELTYGHTVVRTVRAVEQAGGFVGHAAALATATAATAAAAAVAAKAVGTATGALRAGPSGHTYDLRIAAAAANGKKKGSRSFLLPLHCGQIKINHFLLKS
jgi:hypothetical protein